MNGEAREREGRLISRFWHLRGLINHFDATGFGINVCFV